MAPLIVMLVGWLVTRSIGAIGGWPPTDSWNCALRFALAAMFVFTAAASALIALLVAMFPANINAARGGLVIAGRRAMPLVWRLPLQLFWIAALWWVRAS